MIKTFLFIAVFSLMFFAAETSAQKRKAPVRKKPATPAAASAGATPESSAQQDEPTPKAVEFKATGTEDTDGWRVYQSTEDLFKLAFPGTPVVTDSTDNAGQKDGNRYYLPEPVTSVKLALTMTVQWLGVPSIDDDFKRKVYAAWAEGVMSDSGGQKTTRVSQKEFAFGTSFGMEVIAERGSFRYRGRIVCPADKCYQFAVGSGAPDALKPEENVEVEKWTKKFFDSFQLSK